MLLPFVAVLVLLAWATRSADSSAVHGAHAPKRTARRPLSSSEQAVAARAMRSKSPNAMKRAAVAFGGEGFEDIAEILKARAMLSVRPPGEVYVHRRAFVAALGDPEVARVRSEKFKRRGMTASAQFLADYARGAERALSIPLLGPSGEPEVSAMPSDLPTTLETGHIGDPDPGFLPPVEDGMDGIPDAAPNQGEPADVGADTLPAAPNLGEPEALGPDIPGEVVNLGEEASFVGRRSGR